MFKKIIMCIVGLFAVLTFVQTDSGVQCYSIVQAQELENHIWFYSIDNRYDNGKSDHIEYWITAGDKRNDGTYCVSVTQTCNGKTGVTHLYDVKCENGIAYTNLYHKMNGTWGGWEHSDFAQALWNACSEYL